MRSALRDLQASLPASIQAARNGPYLVTNVPAIRTHLGQPLPVPPQVALCRCGGSARKPFCDGSHAGNGFSDAKDPKRVPDRRDTYDGEQVTVFDNRGICQHSGFCTDRLNTVFRAGQEPFVAPSGGRMDEIVRAVRDCPSGALSLAFDGHEERDLADWHGRREPAIEITADGPYRVTGRVTLVDAGGGDTARAEGSSREHYALCRCGHSQNKPFCSGMHWYIGFTDPERTPGREPSLFEWAGGAGCPDPDDPAAVREARPGRHAAGAAVRERPARLPAAGGGADRRRVRRPRRRGRRERFRRGAGAASRRREATPASSAPAGSRWPAGRRTRPACPATPSSARPWKRSSPGTRTGALARGAGAAPDGTVPSWDWNPAGPPDTTAAAAAARRRRAHRRAGAAGAPARAGRAGELRRAHQADVPGEGPAVHAVRLRSVVL